jgi:hypothetical protein
MPASGRCPEHQEDRNDADKTAKTSHRVSDGQPVSPSQPTNLQNSTNTKTKPAENIDGFVSSLQAASPRRPFPMTALTGQKRKNERIAARRGSSLASDLQEPPTASNGFAVLHFVSAVPVHAAGLKAPALGLRDEPQLERSIKWRREHDQKE